MSEELSIAYGLKSVQELCRQQILKSMDKDLLKNIEYDVTTLLPIPKILQSYVKQGVDEFLQAGELVYMDRTNGAFCIATCKRYENKDGKYGPTTGQHGILTF